MLDLSGSLPTTMLSGDNCQGISNCRSVLSQDTLDTANYISV